MSLQILYSIMLCVSYSYVVDMWLGVWLHVYKLIHKQNKKKVHKLEQ